MRFKFSIVNFKKIDLKGITKFCRKYKCDVKMSVKMDSNGIGIKVYDEKRKATISINDIYEVTDEYKRSILDDDLSYDNAVDETFSKCDYEFIIEANSSDEVRLVYLFAMYLASLTRLIFYNLSTQQILLDDELKTVDNVRLEKWVEQYDVREKYLPDVRKWSLLQARAFKIPTVFWIILIFASLIATCLFTVMLVAYEITNAWILGSPFILVAVGVLLWITYNFIILNISNKKLSALYYEYECALCKIWDERMPKKPSGKRVGYKGKVIDALGALILPCIVIGSILLGFEYFLWGFVIVLFPWVGLILIKWVITDEDEKNLYNELHNWLEECFHQKVPDEVVAVNFDLRELGDNNWEINFVWCDACDERSSMWTKKNAREDGKKTYAFKYNACWEGVQDTVIRMIKKYLISQDRTIKIRLFKTMTVGFNDGSVFVIYANSEVVD